MPWPGAIGAQRGLGDRQCFDENGLGAPVVALAFFEERHLIQCLAECGEFFALGEQLVIQVSC